MKNFKYSFEYSYHVKHDIKIVRSPYTPICMVTIAVFATQVFFLKGFNELEISETANSVLVKTLSEDLRNAKIFFLTRIFLIFGAMIQTHNIVTYTIVFTIFTTVQQFISQHARMQLQKHY